VTGFIKWLKEMFMGTAPESCEATSTLTKKIKVKIVMDKNGPCWNYAIEPDDQASDPYVKAGNKIDMGSGAGSGAEIIFRLQGKAGQKLDFKTADPIWISIGSCPTGPTPNFPAGVKLVDSKTDSLTIENPNSDPPVELHYQLNFVDNLGNDVSWDPIIRNGGGGP
jgi:hypothetical protein